MHHLKVPQAVYQLLRLDPEDKTPLFTIFFVWIGSFGFIAFLGFFSFPLILQCAYLFVAVRVANTLKKQDGQGRGDLLAITPLGNMGLIMAVAKAYCYPATFSLKTALKIWAVVTFGLLTMLMISSQYFNYTVNVTFIISSLLAVLFIDHSQCLAWAAMIGILANTYSSGSKIPIFAGVGYIVSQGLLSLGFILSFTWVVMISLRTYGTQNQVFALIVIVALYFGIREVAIAIGWRLIYSRLNDDDIPPLSTV